jgi:hypothetical protein
MLSVTVATSVSMLSLLVPKLVAVAIPKAGSLKVLSNVALVLPTQH